MMAAHRPRQRRAPGALALIVLAGCASPPPSIVLTTDVGTECDDQWALGCLLRLADAGRVDFRGIVTTHAPNLPEPSSHASARAAEEVINVFAPRNRPPVIAGESTPVRPDRALRAGSGAAFIVDASTSFGPGHRLTVLSIGAATDIAEAILLDPSVTGRIQVVAMAFDAWPGGGDAWNVKNDVRAYQLILASAVPLTIAPADVCRRHLVLDEISALRLTGGTPAGTYVASELNDWLTREEDLCRRTTGRRAWPIWDLSVTAHILEMTSSEAHPRPLLREDITFDLDTPAGEVQWITAIDGERFWREVGDLLGETAPRTPEA